MDYDHEADQDDESSSGNEKIMHKSTVVPRGKARPASDLVQ
jgi:hypothetical protein